MNTVNIDDAISNKQYPAAEEGLAQLLRDKLQSAVIERKDVVAKNLAKNIDEEKNDYEEFFEKAMKKFGISSPADLKSEEDKKKFFNYVDKNYKAEKETD